MPVTDPNFFHIDFVQTTEVCVALVLLSLFVERALALLFEHRLFLSRCGGKGVKTPIALLFAIGVCWYWKIDAIAVILQSPANSVLGYVLSGAIVAGGSKASIRFFHEVLNIRSIAHKAAHPPTVS